MVRKNSIKNSIQVKRLFVQDSVEIAGIGDNTVDVVLGRLG